MRQQLLDRESFEVNENFLMLDSIKEVYRRAKLIAEAEPNEGPITCLITGETGTGKEHLSRFIHDQSFRKGREFVTVNCSALNDELLTSELFGHKKGAFTGAINDKIGLLEFAKGGTVFLDEIGDISPFMQQSLLRVLQEKKVRPVGSNEEKRIDVRIISATNKTLREECQNGNFRWDLYYRLSVTELELPSLKSRARKEVKLLLEHFIELKKTQFKRSKALKLSKEAQNVLLSYNFPGNVRELENLVDRFYVFCRDTVDVDDIPKEISAHGDKSFWSLDNMKKKHATEAYYYFDKKVRPASIAMGVSENTLRALLKADGVID